MPRALAGVLVAVEGSFGPSRCSPSPSVSRRRRPSRASTRSRKRTCLRHCSGAPSPGSRPSCSWSGCFAALLAVVVGFSLQAGDVFIGVTCAVAAGFHVSMRRAVLAERLGAATTRAGRPAWHLAQLSRTATRSPVVIRAARSGAVVLSERYPGTSSGAGSSHRRRGEVVAPAVRLSALFGQGGQTRWQAFPDGCSSSRAGAGSRRRACLPPSRPCPDGCGRHASPRRFTRTASPSPAGRAATGPLVVHIPDPRTGEVHLMVGTPRGRPHATRPLSPALCERPADRVAAGGAPR